MNYPSCINELIDVFKTFPGIGEKSAERIIFSLLENKNQNIEKLNKILLEINEKIESCTNCGALMEDGKCLLCNDLDRKKTVICVVETQKNIYMIEKTSCFKGSYHVLGGLISPMKGISPSDINIDLLLKRIENEKIEEVILALKPGIEGSTTSLYLSKILVNKKIIVTKIAQGIPVGAEIDYLDLLTLQMALENRNII